MNGHSVVNRAKIASNDKMNRKELYSQIMMIAIMVILLAWLAFAWTATTGLTFASRSSRGRIATAEDLMRSRHRAVLMTAIGGPIALWAAAMKRQKRE